MALLGLGFADKRDVQAFMNALKSVGPDGLASFTMTFAHGNEAAWSRFLKGAYNHPITWWIGVFQLQMQMGIWGPLYRSAASERADDLWRITKPLRSEVSGSLHGEDAPLLTVIVKYNMQHRKADIFGRLTGSQFTNYASTGGRYGDARLSTMGKLSRGATNFGIASYGAAIKALVEGHAALAPIIQSVLTGRPEHLPDGYSGDIGASSPEDESIIVNKLGLALAEVMSLTQLEPGPVPISEFCARPENVNLKGVCR